MNTPRLLVASESVDDAELVRDLLRAEFQSVDISCIAGAAAEDFERVRPQVVLLAFESLEKAKLYWATLDPSPMKDRLFAQRTIVLCGRRRPARLQAHWRIHRHVWGFRRSTPSTTPFGRDSRRLSDPAMTMRFCTLACERSCSQLVESSARLKTGGSCT
jgi:hypothetical protein